MLIVTAVRSDVGYHATSYIISYRIGKGACLRYHCETSGAESAAAAVMDVALRRPKYTIFAPKEVLDCIPADLRSCR